MAPRPASRCCRVVRSHLASTSSSSTSTSTAADGVWITDSVLASAFARYCRSLPPSSRSASTSTTRRFASNVPGPLESRRRLGKRQMTDQLSMQLSLNPAGSMLPPAWALPNAPDLRHWQWSPPRDAPSSSSSSALLSSRQGRLSSRTATSPPPVSLSSSPSIFPSFGIPTWLTDLGGELAETDLPPTDPTQPLFTKLQDWRQSVREEKVRGLQLSETDFARQLDDICSEFQTQLSLAALTVGETREVLGLVWDGLSDRAGEPESASESDNTLPRYAPMLYAAVLDGIGACRLLQASDFGADFWRDLFVRVSQLPPMSSSSSSSSRTATMALDTLLATPPQFLTQMVDLLPPHLCTIFAHHAHPGHPGTMCMNTSTGASTRTSAGIAVDITHASAERRVGQALQHIDLDRHGSFIDATTELLLQRLAGGAGANGVTGGVPAYNHATTATMATATTTRGWLLTLAHMPQVRQDRLFKTMSQLQSASQKTKGAETETRTETRIETKTETAACSAWHMRSVDLCELFLAQWISRGYVTQQAQRSFHRTMAAMQMTMRGASTATVDRNDHPAALAALALSVFWSKHSRPHCVALYVSLLRGLQMLGRDAAEAADELVPSVAALLASLEEAQKLQSQLQSHTILTLPPAAFFESLAWAADDVHTALRLHELYVNRVAVARLPFDKQQQQQQLQQQKPHEPLWSVGFWNKFADRLAAALDQGLLSPGQVSHALDLSARGTKGPTTRSAKSQRTKYSKSKKALGAPTVALVEKLAVHFALAPNLVPRRALRGVEQCRAFLVAHGRRATTPDEREDSAFQESSSAPQEFVDALRLSSSSPFSPSPPSSSSPTVLRALFHLITRDLEDAQPGRTSRLRWFLEIVEREHSAAAAASSGRALARWREAAMRYRKAEERRVVLEAKRPLGREG